MERAGAIGERPSRPGIGQQKEHGCTGNRLMIFVFHLHDRLARGALPDVVQRAFPAEDVDHQPVRSRWSRGLRTQGRSNPCDEKQATGSSCQVETTIHSAHIPSLWPAYCAVAGCDAPWEFVRVTVTLPTLLASESSVNGCV